MAQFEQKPMTAADIKKYLETRDDFALELRTFHACKKRGFSASHGGTYSDPITQKSRQYDVRASIQRDNRRVQLAVECKSLRSFYPLVVSCTPRAQSESYHEIVVSVPLKPERQPLPKNAKSIRLSETESIYRVGEPVGKATVQVGKAPNGDFIGGDAEVFEKWAQAISSAEDLIAHSQDYLAQTTPCFSTVTIPVLVVANDTLWTVAYSAEGQQLSDPKQTVGCEFYIGKDVGSAFPLFKYTLSHLHILTFDGFAGYLDRLGVNDHYWDIIIPETEARSNLPKT
jgi:hypothetical protein